MLTTRLPTHIIGLVFKLNPPPAISEEASRHETHAKLALNNADNPTTS
jgi:hypothetical protein